MIGKKRVLIVDDHPMIRGGLARLINAQEDLAVCCEASSWDEAMERALSGNPDLAIVDISLSGRTGLELLKDFRESRPEIPVLIVSMHDETVYAERALRAGARGYLMKSACGTTLLEAIRQVLSGKIYLSAKMSERVMAAFAGHNLPRCTSPIERLTDREFQVLELIGQGCTRRQIAQRLEISCKTVDVYRRRLKDKLGMNSGPSLNLHAIHWVEKQKYLDAGI